jgi:hypothetical protein
MNAGRLSMILAGCLVWDSGHGNGTGLQFRAGLKGTQVSPSPVQTNARGKAFFSFAPDLSRMVYRVKLRGGTNFTSVHLHCAPAGVTGPVIADLLGPVAGGWSGQLDITAVLTEANLTHGADCVATIGRTVANPADLAGAMANGQIYVDATSTAFPEGEIRGQAKAFIPPVAVSGTFGSTSGTTRPRGTITSTSTPTTTSVVFSGSGTIPITVGQTSFPSLISRPATVLISRTTVNVPVSFLAGPSTTFAPASFAVTIPDLALSVPGSTFTLPQSGFNPPVVPGATFTLPVGFNPPFPATTVAIPATAITIPATVQTLSPVSAFGATATLRIPATRFPPGSTFPGSLGITLVLSP